MKITSIHCWITHLFLRQSNRISVATAVVVLQEDLLPVHHLLHVVLRNRTGLEPVVADIVLRDPRLRAAEAAGNFLD